MFDNHERVVLEAHHSGNVPGCYLEGFSTNDNGAFAELFEADAVMQTARRTASSVAEARNQEIDVCSSRIQRFNRCWRTGVALRVDWLNAAAVALFEQNGGFA